MKKTFLLSVLIFMIAQSTTFAQLAQPNNAVPTAREEAAAEQLRKFSNHFYVGYLCEAVGGIIYIASVPTRNVSGEILGGLAVITGAVLQLESIGHVGHAGRILGGKDRFGFGPTQSGGIGLAMDL